MLEKKTEPVVYAKTNTEKGHRDPLYLQHKFVHNLYINCIRCVLRTSCTQDTAVVDGCVIVVSI